ncbi:crotonobetainyl-CoA:carnitine CoA-transferase CaiB-like acyl-CoA transferase [Actinocorallia herbida]|uniref:Crotonobetainyl-CoA:carnitine CoA-transferase CaiB-like acyl-CoA transferase n=1 Tax=Actinocorallia herbida TaxID=58109 RepID=A0A3N1CX91_9ACTN|nr:CoA transferase [Actinocorallia herbida]ROO85907.1 crotonobetainyl-CoA:carnitine CoA-transferase CaiB-like acyl-CoA transferase [Actinocorallia herbida]
MSAAPCAGLRVVELAVGVSDLGLGLAGGVPGLLLADLGADVTRIVGAVPVPLDADVPWGRAWHRDKRIVATDDPGTAFALLREADVALVYGPEEVVERRGLGYRDLAEADPSLVYARCRPSRTGKGETADYGLLVEASAGLCTQLAGHRSGPVFVDVRASGVGTASLLSVSVLGLLRRRALTGEGGWAETSLYDGMLATLGCMIGRSQAAPPEVESYWEKGSTFPNFLYRCADGELIQVWFGGKGMYASLLDVLGDEPSEEGYYTDQMTGRLGVRAQRWSSLFSRRPRAEWIEALRRAGVACEPVLAPGEVLAEPHLAEIGLALTRDEDGHRYVLPGSPVSVSPLAEAISPPPSAVEGPGLLAGLRVADFSAFVAGPLAAEVLADLGADVVKVEPPGGEAMRAAAYAVAACQRGKRSVALDIGAAEARPAVERLLEWADVVVHNFRVGVAERLGIGADTVARINPGAVYCHASAFGDVGPRARFPGNDALMQAVTGFETAIGGAGNDPIAATWIPVDMAGGWVAAGGILAGLVGRAADGRGRRVVTSLLGAGMLAHSGVHLRDGELVLGPSLDGTQTGYGPGYRIYECGDGAWLAVVVPGPEVWARLGESVGGLPSYAPLRGGASDEAARKAEAILEAAFASASAAVWTARLRALGVPAEPVESLDRDGFRGAILDDPVNRQTGRAVTYQTADWGGFEQIGPLLRYGPSEAPPSAAVRLSLPRVGEHTAEVLAEIGLPEPDITALLTAGTARQLEEDT